MNLDSLRKDVRVLVTAILLICSTSTLMFAQGIITGSITGNVEDPQGAAVTTAKVVAKNISTNQEFATQANEAGLFALRQLPRGTYTVSVEAAGFQRYQINQTVVEVAKETSLNIKLLVGVTKETVTVEAAAPLVESNSSQVSATFDSKKVAQLPIGVGFDQLALFRRQVRWGTATTMVRSSPPMVRDHARTISKSTVKG